METQETFVRLPLEKIIPNPHQPRRHFPEAPLRSLSQSIRTQGIIQPLIVRPSKTHPGCYELVAGERRWRAMQLTDIRDVPVIIKDIKDQDLLEVALLENIQRENLTPIEEATSYRDLLEQHNYTQEELALRIGKDRSTIANLIRLLQLPSAIQNDLEESRLSVGHARSLLGLPSMDEQLHMREQILKQRWSVRETEKHVKTVLADLSPKDPSAPRDRRSSHNELNLQLMTLETEMQRYFGTKVSIQHQKSGKGHIKIEYYSLDDFDRIYERLKS